MYIRINGKVSDMCGIIFMEDGMYIEHDGYVPDNLGFGGGDYINLVIDNETGRIEGWKPLSWKQIKEAVEI